MADTTINSFDDFLYPMQNATVNSSGVVTSDTYDFAEETYITYRDVKDINAQSGGDNFNVQYLAANPSGPLDDAYSLRAAYLATQFGFTPALDDSSGYGDQGGSLNYLRDLAAYESTIRSLINVNPATLTPLPDEPGQPDYVFADVQSGAVAIINHGERLYMNVDWRNYEYNNNTFTNLVPSQQLRYDYDNGTILRGGQVILPYDSATEQSDGDLSATAMDGCDVARLGNYLVVLNNSSSAYAVKLPVGVGLAEELISHDFYPLSTNSSSPTTISVAAGQAAVFWLDASSVTSSLGTGTDVGAVGTAGSDSYSNGVYTVSGAGGNIGGTQDAFHFVPTSISGNATIAAEILSQTDTSSQAQAGVMLRDGTSASGAFAAVLLTPNDGVMFEYRATAGSVAAWVAAVTPLPAVYVKLTLSGSSVSGYDSSNGINWTQIGTTQTITLPSSAKFGLAVSSHNTAALSTATFGNLSVSDDVAPTIATAATASSTTVTGKTVNLSVLGADVSGESTLTYTWAVDAGYPPQQGSAGDAVTFSANGTNAAKNTTAAFAAFGTYAFRVYATDPSGAYASSVVTVTVVPTITTVSVVAGVTLMPVGATEQLYATEMDQFGMPLAHPQPVVWSLGSGSPGSVDQSGFYTASAAGTASVKAGYPLAGGGAFSGTATLTVQAAVGIFNGTQDIGAPSLAGSASYNSSTGVYTVSGCGTDVYWSGGDQFRYVYVPVTGDATITAELTSVTDTNAWTKAGVMFRDSLSADGAYAFMFGTPTTTNGIAYQYRTSDGTPAAQDENSTGPGTAPPQWLQITRTGDSFAAYTSTNGTTWTQFGTTLTMAMGETMYVGLAVCSHYSGSPALATATFANVSIAQPSRTLPYNQDIGNPTVPGTYSQSGGTITMTAQTGDIWNASDQFQFAYTTLTGNATIVARVDSVTDTSSWAKAGVMIRSSLAADAANVLVALTPGNGVTFQWRPTDGLDQSQGGPYHTNTTGLSAPYWVKLVRSGASFTAWAAPDDSGTPGTWVQMGTAETLPNIGPTAFLGLALSSDNTIETATAVFDNVSITGGTANAAPTVTSVTAQTQSVQYNSASGALTATIASSTVDTITVYINSRYAYNATLAAPSGWTVYQLPDYALEWQSGSLGSDPLAPGTYNLGTLAAGLPLAAFGNSYTGSGGDATGAVVMGSTSGVTTQSQVSMGSGGAALSVAASDDGGASNLTYFWAPVNLPPGNVTFSANGSNAAQNTNVTFSAAGNYTFRVTAVDSGGLTATGLVSVTVNQTLSSFVLSPASANITCSATQQFTATAYDQFGQAMASQPTVTWTLLSGGGNLSSGGLYTPPYAPGTAAVQAGYPLAGGGTYIKTATVTVSGQAQWTASGNSASWGGNGSWTDSASGATIATAAAPGTRSIAGDTVLFASAAAQTANLNGATPTLAGITFNNANVSYTIALGSGNGSLTLQGSNGAAISVQAGSDTISAPVQLGSNTTIDAAANSVLTVSGPVTGNGHSLAVTGPGTVVLSGAGSSNINGVTVTAGELNIGSSSALASGSSLIVGAGYMFGQTLSASATSTAASSTVAGTLRVPSARIGPEASNRLNQQAAEKDLKIKAWYAVWAEYSL